METATSGLKNSCKTFKCLLYTYTLCFLLNADKIHSHVIVSPMYAYTLLILNAIYKDTLQLNQ